MVDLSKYEKVFSWNDYQGKVLSISVMVGPVCYIIKIGGSLYIGETTRLSALASHHLMLLKTDKHPNKAMQDVFNKVGEFDVYILEQLPLHSCIPKKIKQRYIEQLGPDLNKDDKGFLVERDLCSRPKGGEKVSFYLEAGIKSCIDKLCKKHDITVDEMVYSAVVSFIYNYKYINEYGLNQEGIAYVAKALYTNVADEISEIKDV